MANRRANTVQERETEQAHTVAGVDVIEPVNMGDGAPNLSPDIVLDIAPDIGSDFDPSDAQAELGELSPAEAALLNALFTAGDAADPDTGEPDDDTPDADTPSEPTPEEVFALSEKDGARVKAIKAEGSNALIELAKYRMTVDQLHLFPDENTRNMMSAMIGKEIARVQETITNKVAQIRQAKADDFSDGLEHIYNRFASAYVELWTAIDEYNKTAIDFEKVEFKGLRPERGVGLKGEITATVKGMFTSKAKQAERDARTVRSSGNGNAVSGDRQKKIFAAIEKLEQAHPDRKLFTAAEIKNQMVADGSISEGTAINWSDYCPSKGNIQVFDPDNRDISYIRMGYGR